MKQFNAAEQLIFTDIPGRGKHISCQDISHSPVQAEEGAVFGEAGLNLPQNLLILTLRRFCAKLLKQFSDFLLI